MKNFEIALKNLSLNFCSYCLHESEGEVCVECLFWDGDITPSLFKEREELQIETSNLLRLLTQLKSVENMRNKYSDALKRVKKQ